MINLILLAAGYSSRFGSNKLLFPIEGVPMFRHILTGALRFQAESREPVRVILVTAYEAVGDFAKEEEGFKGFSECSRSGAVSLAASCENRILVYNRRQELGISYSIKLGMGAAVLSEERDACMFAVCDQPYLKSGELLSFTERFYASGKGIGCLSHGNIHGNPVIFKRKYKGELLLLTGDTGGKRVMKNHEEDVFFCETEDAAALKDIDRREEI